MISRRRLVQDKSGQPKWTVVMSVRSDPWDDHTLQHILFRRAEIAYEGVGIAIV